MKTRTLRLRSPVANPTFRGSVHTSANASVSAKSQGEKDPESLFMQCYENSFSREHDPFNLFYVS